MAKKEKVYKVQVLCLIIIIIIIIIITIVTHIISIIITIIFFIIFLIIQAITYCLSILSNIASGCLMLATFGSYLLINHLNVLKAEDSSTPIIMPTLPDYQGVSQSLKQTLRVSHMGHQTFKIKEDLVQLHTETSHSNSRFPTSNVICPFINIRVLILIFLIALRLFQSRDYTFF